MNRNFAFALVLASAAVGNALADDITIDPTPFVSTATRAEVLADLAGHRRSGSDPWADGYNQLSTFVSGKTRAQAVAEYMAERGEVSAFTGEDSGSSYMARNVHTDSVTRLAGEPRNAQ